MLPKEHLLPRAERQTTGGERDRDRGLSERGADVRGHIIRAFGAMEKQVVAVGDEPREEALEVAGDLFIRAFVDQQRRARMREKQGADSSAELAGIEHSMDSRSQGDERPPTGLNGQRVLCERDAHFWKSAFQRGYGIP